MFPSLPGLILLFYAALYTFLAAMFGGCMFCLMWSISPYHPTYNDRVMPPGKYKPLHCILHPPFPVVSLLVCPSVCCFYLSLSTVDCLWVSTGRYDYGPLLRGPRDRLQRFWSQILEEVREVYGWVSETWVGVILGGDVKWCVGGSDEVVEFKSSRHAMS